jgi:legume-like lectin family protein/chitobiase/beta-hexosaminidase-like protein
MCEFHCRLHCVAARAAAKTQRLSFLLGLLVLALSYGNLAPRVVAQTPTPVTVPTWRYDLTHAGQNTSETTLTPANVNESTFGKLFSVTVDGSVYAQPLYVPGLTMNDGLVHNVFFVATEHDSVYAFDADSNSGANAQPLWHITLLDGAHGASSGATTVPGADPGGQGDIGPEIGITGTPVIDPATNTLYVVGKTKESGAYFHRLHALNLLTGAEKAHSPVLINGTVTGTGNGSSGGKLAFSELWENQRPALNFFNGHVYIGFGSHGDNGPWHGWLFAYDSTTLAQTAVLCLSPNGFGDAVWQAGAGMPIDTSVPGGRMFLATGNGTFATYPPFTANSEFGDSIVAIDLSNGGLTPVDAFTPYNQAKLSSADLDQGSGGILMVPDQQGANPHILLQAGKEGRILVLNRDQLGGYATGVTSNTNALQDIPNAAKGLWSTPAYWNGNVYVWGSGDFGSYDTAKLFKVNSGVMDTTPSSVSNFTSGHPGATFSVSANGTEDGIAWAVRADAFTTHGNSILYAFDATDLTKVLWESDINTTRDAPGPANKFAVPVVTNGKVYVSAVKEVSVYGLFNNTPVAAAPSISPHGGTFTTPQNVTLSSATSSASIYYTLDGSAPTPASTLYTDPIAITSSTTIRAIATASGFVQSAVSSASFTFSNQTPPVTFQPAAGTYFTTQMVTLFDTDTAATIFYTTDGSTPTASSSQYAAPISVAASMTIKAIAIDPSLQNSSVTTAAYTIQAAPTINFGNGFASVAGLKLNGTAISTNNLLQLTSTAGTYQTGTVFWNQPVGVQTFSTDFSFQLSSAQGDGFTFTIQNVGATALGASGSGLGYQNIGKSVAIKFDLYSNAGEGTDSTGVYTNGAVPTVPAVDMTSSGLLLRSGDAMRAHVTYDGTTLSMTLTDQVTNKTFSLSKAINIPQVVGANTAFVGFTGSTGGLSAIQKILTWTYSTQASNPVTSAPVFSPPAGSYTTAQNVTITESTFGAAIYYTTNGTAPTTASSIYSSPIAVGAGTTQIEAMAVASGSSQSVTVNATYVVSAAVTALPTFNPGGGSYSTAQNVTIADSTSGAVIYYTTNGTTPTTTSTVYSTPITVAASETIKAMAVAPGAGASAAATAVYTIQTAGSTIDFPNGFSSSAGLSLKGSAVVTNNLLQLTLATAPASAAAMWFTTPVNINAFTTDFNFQLLSPKADGFTFAIQNAGISAIGPNGSGLGYGASHPGGTPGIGRSVAIKFDLYNNNGESPDSTGVYTNGASPTVPATDMTASGVKLSSGHVMHAHITYDGTNLTLVLTDTVTAASFTQTTAVNIPSIVGSGTAHAGFTAGTGGLTMTADILSWTLGAGTNAAIKPAIARPAVIGEAGANARVLELLGRASSQAASIPVLGSSSQPTTMAEPAIAETHPVSITGEPQLFPQPGVFARDTMVTLRCDTPGAIIHYTVDSSQPVDSSPVYGAPISVEGTELTIKAFASVPGRKDSAVVTGIYRIRD